MVKDLLSDHAGIEDAFGVVHDQPSTGYHVTGDETANRHLFLVRPKDGDEFVLFAGVDYETEFNRTERGINMIMLPITQEQMERFKFRPDVKSIDAFVDALWAVKKEKAREGIETGDVDMRRVEFHWRNATDNPERTFSTTAFNSKDDFELASKLVSAVESGEVIKIDEYVKTEEIVVRD